MHAGGPYAHDTIISAHVTALVARADERRDGCIGRARRLVSKKELAFFYNRPLVERAVARLLVPIQVRCVRNSSAIGNHA